MVQFDVKNCPLHWTLQLFQVFLKMPREEILAGLITKLSKQSSVKDLKARKSNFSSLGTSSLDPSFSLDPVMVSLSSLQQASATFVKSYLLSSVLRGGQGDWSLSLMENICNGVQLDPLIPMPPPSSV